MQMSGNTILITGGASGIGRALAESFHKAGNKVIIAGRRKQVLDETTAANQGMESLTADVASAEGIHTLAERAKATYPSLNVVIHNAGIMRPEDLKSGKVADAETIVATNLLAPILLTEALMPLLLAQPKAVILTVSSGLAFLPLATTPTYCATKAAIHSWTQSLRHQLRDTSVQVIEIAPPYVQTELMGPQQAKDPTAMPLAEFIAEVMQILRSNPDVQEVLVERVKILRFAEVNGNYAEVFAKLNSQTF